MKKRIALACLALSFSMPFLNQANEIELPEIGDSAGAIISPQQEFRIGQSFYWRLQQQVDLVDDPEVADYLSQLGRRLVSNSDAPNLPFMFFMVPDDRVNAFAAPGGFIGVNSGLLLTSQEEDEVASVIAHEIAHITQRHLVRRYERQSQMSFPTTAALIAAALLGAADAKAGAAAITAVQAGTIQSQLSFSRAHESEADNLGMQMLVRSGFNALAMPTFFERLQQANQFHSGKSIPEFLRSHPVTSSRIAESRGRAVQYETQRQLSDNLQFYLMREKLRVMTASNLSRLHRYYLASIENGSSLNDTAARYGHSLVLKAMGRYSQAKNIALDLISEDEDNLSFQLLLADIEMTRGNVDKALPIYQSNYELYSEDYALTVNYAKALLAAKKAERASELLLSQLSAGNNTQQVYKLLARARGDVGDTSQAHNWLAEYYFHAGRLKQAVDQLKLAAKFAEGDKFQSAKINSRLSYVEKALAELEEL